MSYNLDQHPGKTGSIWILLAAALAFLAWAFGAVTWASAQKLTPPNPACPHCPTGRELRLPGQASACAIQPNAQGFQNQTKIRNFLAP